jgi:hypothetical protein
MGAGMGTAGGGGGLPMSGMTAFGFKGKGKGLSGRMYDLKQTKERQPTGINDSSDTGLNKGFAVMEDFFHDWNAKRVFEDKGGFYQAEDSVVTTQVFIPDMDANKAPEAFGQGGKIAPVLWFIHYKGKVIPQFSGRFRFIGRGDNLLAVRFDGLNVLVDTLSGHRFEKLFPGVKSYELEPQSSSASRWIEVSKGKSYDMEVALSEWGGLFQALLFVEREQPESSYPKGKLPVFQLNLEVPILPLGGNRQQIPAPLPMTTPLFK